MLAGSPFPVIGQAAQFLSRAGKTVFQKNLIKIWHCIRRSLLTIYIYQQYWSKLICFWSKFFCNLLFFVRNFNNLTPYAEMNQFQCQEKSLKPEEPHLAIIGKRKEVFLLLLYSSVQQIFPWSPNVQLMMGWFKLPRKGNCGTTMQAAFFGNFFLKSTLDDHP